MQKSVINPPKKAKYPYRLIIRLTINNLSKDKKGVKINQGNLRNWLENQHLLKKERLQSIAKRQIKHS